MDRHTLSLADPTLNATIFVPIWARAFSGVAGRGNRPQLINIGYLPARNDPEMGS